MIKSYADNTYDEAVEYNASVGAVTYRTADIIKLPFANHETAAGRRLPDLPTLCPYELSSVRAMVVYIANNQNVVEDIVAAMVEKRFDVSGIAQLRHDDFRNAIAFLMDLRIGEAD